MISLQPQTLSNDRSPSRLRSAAKAAALITASCLSIVTVAAVAAPVSLSLALGNAGKVSFGGYGPGFPISATTQIQTFTIQPGDFFPWHFHKGATYVILAHGTLSEQHAVSPGHCAREVIRAGHAFTEEPGQIHTVTNVGNDAATIVWTTTFPTADGITVFSPDFKSGGTYFVATPDCGNAP